MLNGLREIFLDALESVPKAKRMALITRWNAECEEVYQIKEALVHETEVSAARKEKTMWPYKWTEGESMTTTPWPAPLSWCSGKHEYCQYATEFGYCKISACLKNVQYSDHTGKGENNV